MPWAIAAPILVGEGQTTASSGGSGGPGRSPKSALEQALREARAELERRDAEHRAHLRFLESLEQVDRVIRQAGDLESMMQHVLDAVLGIFDCERAWLLYPCDADAPSFRVPMERTRPEWPGALTMGAALPVIPEAAEAFRLALASPEPVTYDPRSGRPVPFGEQFSTLSQIILAVHPKQGKPWIFGLHQCSHPRIWSDDDTRLFKEVGRRVADGLSSLLLLKDLRESEKRYRALADAAREMVFVVGRDGRIEHVNTIAAEQFGRRPEELVGVPRASLFPPEVSARQERAVQAVLESGAPSYVESETPVPGRVLWLGTWLVPLRDDAGTVTSVLGVSRDVTERRRAEEALKDSERRFRDFVEHALVGVYRTTPDGRVLMANPALARLLGFPSLDALLESNLEQWAQECGFPRLSLRETLDRAGFVDGFESSLIRAGGDTLYLRESARAVRGESGEVAYYEGIIEDLTAQKALEAHLVQAQKMEAVGRLAGGIAHDFNNLLQALLSSTQAARLQARDPVLAGSLADIQAQVQRGAALTRQLLLFSRQAPAHRERLDLGTLVAEQASMLRRLLPETITFIVETAMAPLPVEADAGQLGQVLTNLVVNARDAMADSGRLAISAFARGPAAVIEVADSGVGITREVRDRIFDPFFTTKPQGKGTGLGLAVVWGIVREHGGQVEVDSVTGSGATFRVVLPLAAGTAETPTAAPPELALPVGRGERVLLIEDEEGARKGLADLLAGLRYAVTSVASAEDAVALSEPAPYDLLLTDFRLPGANGIDVARTLVERWPALKVVVMSGYAPEDISHDLFIPDAVHFLQKPFDMATLAKALRTTLDGAAPRSA